MCVSHGIRLPFEYIAKIQNKFHIHKFFRTFFQVFLEIFFSAQITHPYPAIKACYCAIRAGYWSKKNTMNILSEGGACSFPPAAIYSGMGNKREHPVKLQ